MLFCECTECLVCALQNALCSDVDPRTGRHLTVHHEALAIQFLEVLPRGPTADEVRVRDQNAWGMLMCTKDTHGFARLNQECLIRFKSLETPNDGIERFPTTCSFASPAVHDQGVRLFGNLRIEVVHDHPKSSLLRPSFAGHFSTPRCSYTTNTKIGHPAISAAIRERSP